MSALFHKITAILAAYGPWGIFVLAAIDSVGIPLSPGLDLLVVLTGAGSVHSPQRAYFFAAMAVVGSVGGNIALFMAARGGARWLKRNQAPSEKSQRFRDWFARYGLLTVFFPAMTPAPPLPLKVFVVSAGALRSSFAKFVVVITTARIIRYFTEAYLGLELGEDAAGFLARHGWAVAGVACGLAIAAYIIIRITAGRRQPVLR